MANGLAVAKANGLVARFANGLLANGLAANGLLVGLVAAARAFARANGL